MAGLISSAANLFKRNSVYISTVFVGAFAFGIAFDKGSQAFWDYHNKGKQWKDIRDKYIEKA